MNKTEQNKRLARCARQALILFSFVYFYKDGGKIHGSNWNQTFEGQKFSKFTIIDVDVAKCFLQSLFI